MSYLSKKVASYELRVTMEIRGRSKLKTQNSQFATSAGFTLIELMVVLAISAFLTTMVIAYSNVSQNSVSLSVEETTIAQEIARAKSLSISTYATADNAVAGDFHACGFGVVFDYSHNTYSLVAYAPKVAQQGGSCPSEGTLQTYGASSTDFVSYGNDAWQMPLTAGVDFATTTISPMTLVFFYPPEPDILLTETACAVGDINCTYQFLNESGNIPLVTADGHSSSTITVGTAGEVDW